MSTNSKGWVYDNILIERLGLTHREGEVLAWVTDGKTNAEIGLILDRSPRTVQKHLEHIFEKLGVATRTAAAVRALNLTSSQAPH
ncbi:MAG: helix-turn-helix transcriptional regulator [candidate division NC10 bacterium]|nr:helix-turn-helix transcriptional regulator [candidate division NC10 bacterium]